MMENLKSFLKTLFKILLALALVMAGIALILNMLMGKNDEGDVLYLNGDRTQIYDLTSIHTLVRDGFISENIIPLAQAKEYIITDSDIGAFLGTVTESTQQSLVNSKAYHFLQLPENDSIGIVDAPTGYAVFVLR